MRFLVRFHDGKVFDNDRMFFTRNAHEAMFWASMPDHYIVIETTTNFQVS